MFLDMLGNAQRRTAACGKLGRFVLVAGFIAITAAPGIGKLVSRMPDQKESVDESRLLAQLPKLSLSSGKFWEFPAAFERYFNDQFPYRRQLIKPYDLFLVSVLGVSPNPFVTIGKRYWYYSGIYDDRCGVPSERPLPEARKQKIMARLLARRDALHRRGIRYYYFITPGKKYVLSEDLPAYLRRFPITDPMADLVSYIRAHSDFNIHYLGPELMAHKQQFKIFHRYDSHWNLLGGLFGSQKILSVIGRDYRGVKPITLDQVTVSWGVRPFGDLQGLVGLRGYLTETQPEIAIKGGARAKPANRDLHFPVSTIYKDYNWINHATEIDDPALPTAVFISDSFGDYVMPYLSENFRRILYIRQPQPGHNDMAVIDAEKPDMVIELHMSAGLACYTL